MMLWVLFAAELAALLVLAVQRGVAERQGSRSWLVGALEPAIARAAHIGEERQATHPGLPLDEERLQRRLSHVVRAGGLLLAVPGLLAVAEIGLPWETMLLAFAV